MAKRQGYRPKFEPNTEAWAPNTVEEQKEDHDRYYDLRHDLDLAEKLHNEIINGRVDILTSSDRAKDAVLKMVQDLRLTTY